MLNDYKKPAIQEEKRYENAEEEKGNVEKVEEKKKEEKVEEKKAEDDEYTIIPKNVIAK